MKVYIYLSLFLLAVCQAPALPVSQDTSERESPLFIKYLCLIGDGDYNLMIMAAEMTDLVAPL